MAGSRASLVLEQLPQLKNAAIYSDGCSPPFRGTINFCHVSASFHVAQEASLAANNV